MNKTWKGKNRKKRQWGRRHFGTFSVIIVWFIVFAKHISISILFASILFAIFLILLSSYLRMSHGTVCQRRFQLDTITHRFIEIQTVHVEFDATKIVIDSFFDFWFYTWKTFSKYSMKLLLRPLLGIDHILISVCTNHFKP